jgi:TIR domain
MSSHSDEDKLFYVTEYEAATNPRLWSTGDKFAENAFNRARKVNEADVFVSHTWVDPVYLKYARELSFHKGETEFWEAKCLSIRYGCWALQDRKILPRLGGISRTSGLSFWIDRACINPRDAGIKRQQIESLEKFIKKSKSLIVLGSPNYFRRLWCVYEIACYLMTHSFDRIEIETYNLGAMWITILPQIHSSVRNLKAANTECTFPEDREILKAKINEYYSTFESFEIFARVCISFLIFRAHITGTAQYDDYQYERMGLIWLKIIEDTGFRELAQTLEGFNAPREWEKFKENTGYNSPDHRWAALVDSYIRQNVQPLIDKFRSSIFKIHA